MRVFVRSSALAVLASLVLAGTASADTQGLFLPDAPTGPGGEDSIETPGGTRCRQSINSNGAYMDVGVVGNAASSNKNDVPGGAAFYGDDDRDRQATAYARLTIPLGKKPKRIDCSTVYELEIERLKREVELLRMAAQ